MCLIIKVFICKEFICVCFALYLQVKCFCQLEGKAFQHYMQTGFKNLKNRDPIFNPDTPCKIVLFIVSNANFSEICLNPAWLEGS